MATEKNRKTSSEPKISDRADTTRAQSSAPVRDSAPKPTVWENMIMTIKVLAIAGAVILLLWLLDRGVS